MSFYVRRAVFSVLLGLAGCQQATHPTTTPADLPPDHTTVLGAASLKALYDDKTWDWKDGGAFFAVDGRFRAWTTADGKPSYATGFWWVNDQGRMCFDGLWRSGEGNNSAVTCFDHRENAKTVYQRRESSGPWYVFRSDPIRPDDEFSKLKPGDEVEAQLHKLEKQLAAEQPPRPSASMPVKK